MSDTAASAVSGQGSVGTTSAAIATAPAAPAEPTSIQVSPAPTSLPSAPPITWLDGADETTVGYVQNKGWSDPKQVLDGYRNLEKLLGADKANNAVIVPRADAKPEEWGAVWDRMGRPTAPDGYKGIENASPELQKAMFGKFYELGLSKTQGESVAQWISELGTQNQSQAQAEAQARFQQEDQAIKTEWGAAYTQNLAQAQAAARGLGLDAESIDKMSNALGHKATMSLLQKIGSRMTEDSFVSGERTETFGNALTPGQAKAQIQNLMQDRDFTKQYLAGNQEAKAKMEALHRFAYPEM